MTNKHPRLNDGANLTVPRQQRAPSKMPAEALTRSNVQQRQTEEGRRKADSRAEETCAKPEKSDCLSGSLANDVKLGNGVGQEKEKKS